MDANASLFISSGTMDGVRVVSDSLIPGESGDGSFTP